MTFTIVVYPPRSTVGYVSKLHSVEVEAPTYAEALEIAAGQMLATERVICWWVSR